MKAKQMPMVRVERAQGLVLVSFTVSTIDQDNFVRFVDELEEVARSPSPQSVVIDLTGVRHVDELGLVVLQSLRESVKDVGGTAVLRGPTDQIERAVTETRLAREAKTRDSRHRTAQATQL